MVGSLPCLGSWNPDRFGLKMHWSSGHCWWADVPLDTSAVKLNETKFEFKFVVMENGKTKSWEQGENHVFDGQQVQRILSSHDVKGHIANRENLEIIEIGSFTRGSTRLCFDNTAEERSLPAPKSKISYFKAKRELRYH